MLFDSFGHHGESNLSHVISIIIYEQKGFPCFPYVLLHFGRFGHAGRHPLQDLPLLPARGRPTSESYLLRFLSTSRPLWDERIFPKVRLKGSYPAAVRQSISEGFHVFPSWGFMFSLTGFHVSLEGSYVFPAFGICFSPARDTMATCRHVINNSCLKGFHVFPHGVSCYPYLFKASGLITALQWPKSHHNNSAHARLPVHCAD